MSFASLKKNRKNAIDKLVKAAETTSGGGEQKKYGDDRIWKLTVDKSGNGYAVLRFLPAPEGEDLPWVKYFDHAFQGPSGQWYIEKSLTSIGQQDPISEHNRKLWNSGYDEDKDTVRKQKRRLHYVANVYVVSDPANPQNEGKVMLYQFGQKIYEKIMDVMQPQFADEDPINPFDLWEGADFKLKARNVSGYRNYDKSEFASPSEFMDGDDDALEELYGKCHSLAEFLDPKSYKTYAELEARLNTVLGQSAPMTTAESIALDEVADEPVMKTAPAPKRETVTVTADDDDDDDDDAMSYFKKLAAD